MSVEYDYWEARYAKGRTSGVGSIGYLRRIKWDWINSYVPKITSVIDVGCGDLSFWESRDCKDYIGIDISPTVIEANRKARPHWKFIVADVRDYIEDIHTEVVFCLEVLNHISDLKGVIKIIENLKRYSDKWIFIHVLFKKSDFKLGSHMFYYDPQEFAHIEGFKLIRVHTMGVKMVHKDHKLLVAMLVFKRNAPLV